MPHILIINGAPRSGKDTFIDFLIEINFNINKYSSIDWVKSKAINLGWDGIKDKKGRKFLSDIKNAVSEYGDIPFKQIIDKIKISNDDFLCINIREPDEIKKLCKYCSHNNIKCNTIRIINKKAEIESSKLNNFGDNNYMDYNYDYYINNNDNIELFKNAIINFYSVLNKN